MDLVRANRLTGVALAVLAAAAPWHMPAFAQTVQLPLFSACTPASPPQLPARWRAVGLLSPFGTTQLDVGEFVYDGTLPVMRATVYGLESGAVDLLITNTDTYLLSGPYSGPNGCASLGRRFSPPSAQWLPGQALCVGETSLAATPVQWWKTPVSEARANWFWFKSDTRLPWRSLFAIPTPDPAVIGDYAMTYFPTFAALSETNLSRLRDFCVSRASRNTTAAAAAAQNARALMEIRNPPAEAERLARIGTLIPGLSQQACAGMTPARWPDQFMMTAVITPIRYEYDPFPSVIHYDWTGAGALGVILFQPREQPPAPVLMFSLKRGIGYDARLVPPGKLECRPIYPGVVRPDWMAAAGCKCKGVIDRNPALSPNEVTQILACPIKHQEPRAMWSWYTTAGRPILFAEAAAAGSGLMLADYSTWQPGHRVPAAEFDFPQQCMAPDSKALPTASCVDCHSTRP